jgi:large subunit ribosomal protein L31
VFEHLRLSLPLVFNVKKVLNDFLSKKESFMKKNTHPPYQDVLFVDSSTGIKFICGSTLQPKERETFEGKEYPVCRVSISSASHPFFTGATQFIDSEGRVDKFQKRYMKKKEEEKAKVAAVAAAENEEKQKKKKGKKQ